jgi:hypothetical protein
MGTRHLSMPSPRDARSRATTRHNARTDPGASNPSTLWSSRTCGLECACDSFAYMSRAPSIPPSTIFAITGSISIGWSIGPPSGEGGIGGASSRRDLLAAIDPLGDLVADEAAIPGVAPVAHAHVNSAQCSGPCQEPQSSVY